MHDIMVKPLPSGCRLTSIFDASSTLACPLDLVVDYFFCFYRSAVILDPHWVSTLILAILALSNAAAMEICHTSYVPLILFAIPVHSVIVSQYCTEGKIREPNLALDASQGLVGAVSSYSRGDMGGVLRSVSGFVKTATAGRSAQERARQTKTSPADVVRRVAF